MGNLVRLPHCEVSSTLEVMDEVGIHSKCFDRIRADKDFAKRLSEFIAHGAIPESASQQIARELFGDCYFGPSEWDALTRYHVINRQLEIASSFPWSREELCAPCPFIPERRVFETHVAFYAPEFLWPHQKSVSQNFWCENVYTPVVYSNPNPETPFKWRTQTFAIKICPAQWNLLFIGGVPGSHNLTYADQCKLLPKGYDVPLTIEFTIGMHAWMLAVEKKMGKVPFQERKDWGQVWLQLPSTYHWLHLASTMEADSGMCQVAWQYSSVVGPVGYLKESANIPQPYLGLAAVRRGLCSK